MKEKYLIPGLISPVEESDLVNLLFKQLGNFFESNQNELNFVRSIQRLVSENLYTCISGVQNKYYQKNNLPYFTPYHSGQYLTYLYYMSHTCYKNGAIEISEKIYYLNKIMHSCDIYPAVCLPKIFFLEHPVGTVLGRAKYGENFFAMQGCTVGGNKNIYPEIGNNVRMYSNSKIIGNSKIGDNVLIAANTYIKDTNIPDNKMVFGQFPDLIIKENRLT